ncbi:MAG TPA: hypothetical protein VKZ18_27995 [Polyangia bacterium]|nr:hypothetical protein [Polyangia bacterium]
MRTSPRRFRTALASLGALAIGTTIALTACTQATTEREIGSLTISSGVTLTSATYWVIAPDGTTTTGTVTVGASPTVLVSPRGLTAGTGYQLIVSGVASDGVTGCSGSTTFSVPTPSTGVPVTLKCATPPDAGQALVTAATNLCPVVDGISVDTASVNVGGSMVVSVLAHDPDSGPSATLSYSWSANSGSLSSTSGSASTTFTCTTAASVTISVVVSDGDRGCNVTQTIPVTCTGAGR